MPTFVTYLDFWFTDLPLIERVRACAELGMTHVQVWAWRSKPMSELVAECQRWGLTLNDTFDEDAGSLVDREDHPRCLDRWAESLEMASRYHIPHLYLFSNQIGSDDWAVRLSRGYSPMEQYANLLDGIARLLEQVEKTEITLWFEALNTFHLQGVLVNTHALAADVVRRINHPQLRLAFDCYHQQRTAGNLIYGLESYQELYDTVHIADVPTRAEPGTGEIHYPKIAETLKKQAFNGQIGLEFKPSGDPHLVWQAMQTLFG
jgi:hydroxypyruvate isomerase